MLPLIVALSAHAYICINLTCKDADVIAGQCRHATISILVMPQGTIDRCSITVGPPLPIWSTCTCYSHEYTHGIKRAIIIFFCFDDLYAQVLEIEILCRDECGFYKGNVGSDLRVRVEIICRYFKTGSLLNKQLYRTSSYESICVESAVTITQNKQHKRLRDVNNEEPAELEM